MDVDGNDSVVAGSEDEIVIFTVCGDVDEDVDCSRDVVIGIEEVVSKVDDEPIVFIVVDAVAEDGSGGVVIGWNDVDAFGSVGDGFPDSVVFVVGDLVFWFSVVVETVSVAVEMDGNNVD